MTLSAPAEISEAKSHALYPLAMAAIYVLTAGLLGLLVYCRAAGEPCSVADEDGLVESGTLVAFGLCALLAFLAAIMQRARLARREKVLLIVFGLLCLAAVGEEISWGQRVFGLKVPQSLSKEAGGAIQAGHKDLTVHNLTLNLGFMKFSVGGVLLSLPLFVGLFLHGVWLPVRVKAGKPVATGVVKRLGLFLPPLHLGILVFAVSLFLHYIHSVRSWRALEPREYKEMLIPAVYAFALLHVFFRQRTRANVIVTACALGLLAIGLVWSVIQGMTVPGHGLR